jgi:RimJ/RimL family protein N-acetyltransferase
VIRTPRLELRAAREADIIGLLELADRGVHDPETMPFLVPWTDTPTRQRHFDSMRYYLSQWANWSLDSWSMNFATYADGELVGTQGISADAFGQRRCITSGSWIGIDHQGEGYGKEQRVAALTFAFDGLGALVAETEAFWDNGPSNSVTRWLRYEPNGEGIALRRAGADRVLRYRLTRSRWEQRRRRGDLAEVEIEGLDAAIGFFRGSDVPWPSE